MGWPITKGWAGWRAWIPTFGRLDEKRVPRLYQPLFLALALLLTACAGLGGLTQAQQIDIACESASSATYILTVMKAQGKLSDPQISSVDQAINLIDPICGAAIRPTAITALDTVNRALFTLNGVKLAPARPTGG